MTRSILLALATLPLATFLMVVDAAGQAADAELDRAKRLLDEVPLIEGHNDLPWALRTKFAASLDSLDLRQRQPELMTDIPRLRAGMVGAQFWSTYTPVSFAGHGAARAGMEQVDLVLRMVKRYPETFELAETADDIERIHREGRIASLIGLEGGYMIENSLGVLRDFYQLGVRYMTLTHSKSTDWADASTDTAVHDGLTPFGEEVVREMNRLGMLVDLSHVSDATMRDALRVSEAPLICSHSSSRHFTPHPRNVPDDIARALAENGGVIMVNFVTPFIHGPTYEWNQAQEGVREAALEAGHDVAAADAAVRAWAESHPMPRPDIGVVADHIEHLRDVAGVDHVGIGSDFDGIENTPIGLEDVSTYPALIAELLRRDWSDEDAKKLIGLNVLRVMREVESAAARLQAERPPSTAQIEILDGWETPPPWSAPTH